MNRNTLAIAILLFLCPLSASAQFVGYTGKKWTTDFGVASGTCDAAAVAGSRDGAVAMLRASKTTGSLEGADLGCWGHALELLDDKKTVVWINRDKLARYRVTLTRNLQQSERPCREFTFQMMVKGRDHLMRGVACRGEAGWEIRS